MQGSGRDTDVKDRLMDSVGGAEGEVKRIALKHVYHHM